MTDWVHPWDDHYPTDPVSAPIGEIECRNCGCWNECACIHLGTGNTCSWVDGDLCSACSEDA